MSEYASPSVYRSETGVRCGRSAKGMIPSVCRGWPVCAEHRRACPKSVESRNRGNLARSSKNPGLVYLQALDATSAERGCGAEGCARGCTSSPGPPPRRHTSTHIDTYTRYTRSFQPFPYLHPHLSDFVPPLCLYRFGNRTGEYTALLSLRWNGSGRSFLPYRYLSIYPVYLPAYVSSDLSLFQGTRW